VGRFLSADILVVGGGIAGLTAAVEAKGVHPQAVVILLDKCEAGKSGSSVQAKGLAGVGRWSFPEDSKHKHLEDTLAAGDGLSSPSMARLMVEGVESAIERLEAMGMQFDPKDPGHYSAPDMPSAGHRHYRYVNLKDGTGKVLQDVLRRRAQDEGVVILNGHQVADVVVEDGRSIGVIAWDFAGGELVPVAAQSTILATGGAGYLFSRTSNPPQVTGDGIWLAYRAGAELVDLEMVQFYPVNYVYPEALEGKNVGSYGEARLYSVEGERFMERYDPRNLENTTRDRLSQAIYTEIREGHGTEHGGVLIDRTGLPSSYYEQFPVEVQTTLDGGLDIRVDRGEVSPAAHYLMGGVRVDVDCASTVPALYAAGEVAGGVHGANRLANNSLSDTLVLGFAAGRAAAEAVIGRTRRINSVSLERALGERKQRFYAALSCHGESSPFSLIDSVRHLMWEDVGVVRTQSGLERAIARLAGLAASAERDVSIRWRDVACSTELAALLEAEAMLGVGELIARSALCRTESRGAHCRIDFPSQNDAEWLCNIVVTRGTNGPLIAKRPVATSVPLRMPM
jgi:fumarate reductase (CoM/CoB) subunit A